MRIQQQQIEAIKCAVARLACSQARGGDIDLLVELPQAEDHPVWLEARVAAAIEIALGTRHGAGAVNATFLAGGA